MPKRNLFEKIKPLRDAISRAHLGKGEEEEEDTTLGREQQEIWEIFFSFFSFFISSCLFAFTCPPSSVGTRSVNQIFLLSQKRKRVSTLICFLNHHFSPSVPLSHKSLSPTNVSSFFVSSPLIPPPLLFAYKTPPPHKMAMESSRRLSLKWAYLYENRRWWL